MALGLKKTIYLDFIDETMKDCYLRFKPFGFERYKEYIDVFNKVDTEADVNTMLEQLKPLIPFFKELFIEGKVFDENGEMRDARVEDLDDLPVEFYTHTIVKFTETIRPKL